MAPFGNIIVNWTTIVNGIPVSNTHTYPNQDMGIVRPIDIINMHSGPNRPGHGMIWKMRKTNRAGGQTFDDRLSHYEPFASLINGITGNADVIVDQF